MNKDLKYRQVVMKSLQQQWVHLEQLLLTIPGNDIDYNSLTKQQKQTVNNILSVEEEWILDPEIRRELSIIEETND